MSESETKGAKVENLGDGTFRLHGLHVNALSLAGMYAQVDARLDAVIGAYIQDKEERARQRGHGSFLAGGFYNTLGVVSDELHKAEELRGVVRILAGMLEAAADEMADGGEAEDFAPAVQTIRSALAEMGLNDESDETKENDDD